MSTQLAQYQMVRVRCLLRDAEHYDGWNVNQRAPAVGDVGTIVDILHAADAPDSYVVESTNPHGVSVWIGDFLALELEPA